MYWFTCWCHQMNNVVTGLVHILPVGTDITSSDAIEGPVSGDYGIETRVGCTGSRGFVLPVVNLIVVTVRTFIIVVSMVCDSMCLHWWSHGTPSLLRCKNAEDMGFAVTYVLWIVMEIPCGFVGVKPNWPLSDNGLTPNWHQSII